MMRQVVAFLAASIAFLTCLVVGGKMLLAYTQAGSLVLNPAAVRDSFEVLARTNNMIRFGVSPLAGAVGGLTTGAIAYRHAKTIAAVSCWPVLAVAAIGSEMIVTDVLAAVLTVGVAIVGASALRRGRRA